MCCTTGTNVKQMVFHTCLEAWALRNILFNADVLWRHRATFFHLTLIRIIQNSKPGMKCHGSLSHVHTCDISWARGLNSVYSFWMCGWTMSLQVFITNTSSFGHVILRWAAATLHKCTFWKMSLICIVSGVQWETHQFNEKQLIPGFMVDVIW